MSIILNKEELGTNELRKNALDILEAGLEAIDTEKVLRKKIRIENENLIIQNGNTDESTVVPLSYSGRGARGEGKVIFIGIGKCALDGAKVIEDILGDYLTEGIALDVREAAEAESLVNRGKIKYYQGTHPLPSEQNVEATKEILNMVGDLNKNDLVIALISGGGSALFEFPKSKFNLDTIIEKTRELTAQGADIYELNVARKEMSQVKGGKFARIIAPAQVISLIFSDVLGNDISVIASGPTVLDEPNEKVKNILLVSNRDALIAMKIKAEELGFDTTIETEKLSGNASETGKELALRESKSKTCILFGGETTVRVPQNHGIGGRNQEMALSALMYMSPNSVLVCAASDGWDNTDHAGAIADAELFQKTTASGISLEQFLMYGDSYNFFKQVGGAICTGKLGSNVSDLYIMLYE
jgi:glycerate 2-kinase